MLVARWCHTVPVARSFRSEDQALNQFRSPLFVKPGKISKTVLSSCRSRGIPVSCSKQFDAVQRRLACGFAATTLGLFALVNGSVAKLDRPVLAVWDVSADPPSSYVAPLTEEKKKTLGAVEAVAGLATVGIIAYFTNASNQKINASEVRETVVKRKAATSKGSKTTAGRRK